MAWLMCVVSLRMVVDVHEAEFGKGGIPSVKFARTVKTIALHRMPQLFIKRLASEIRAKVALEGEIFCRLNDYSDLRWEL